ncbi:recombinase family protein, partial [Desulfosporosinus metallidurans]|uniref:recombinase family protein n=1 Tax=Desulfosporosinus metallidurans TaxID=1888891 RepID=UPI001115262B
DGTGELLITILGSLAQEESRSLSTNTRWGVVRRFEKGQVYLNYTQFLGYTKNQEGELVIVPEEAEIVRLIFRLYLEGCSFEKIKEHLEKSGIKTVTGKDKWHVSTIAAMISNEKYMGDALLQKSYTTDFINKTRVKNKGIVPQYYVEGSHEGIISKELWNRVQEERARRANIRKSTDKRATTDNGKYSSKYALSNIVLCGECGKPYRRATWTNYTEKRIVWRCSNRQEYGKKYCKHSPTIDEPLLQDAIMNDINLLIGDKEDFINTLASNLQMVMGKQARVMDIP